MKRPIGSLCAHPVFTLPPRATPPRDRRRHTDQVVNQTSLHLVFASAPSRVHPRDGAHKGRPTATDEVPLPPRSERGHAWCRGGACEPSGPGAAATRGGERCLRFRLGDDWHWSEPAEMGWREWPRWLTLGPPDNYVLLQLTVEETALQRTMTLAASHEASRRAAAAQPSRSRRVDVA